MKLSIIVPVLNEAEHLSEVVSGFDDHFSQANVEHEILIVDDHSTDKTPSIMLELSNSRSAVKSVENPTGPGYGRAIRFGIQQATGDCVAFVMADGSDSPRDLLSFYGYARRYECVFGSRFIPGGAVVGYPRKKLIVNRLASWMLCWLFRTNYNDLTSSLKLYHRSVLDSVGPLRSSGFALNLEIALKAVLRGHSYVVLPNRWKERKAGGSKFKLRTHGPGYVRVILQCIADRYWRLSP